MIRLWAQELTTPKLLPTVGVVVVVVEREMVRVHATHLMLTATNIPRIGYVPEDLHDVASHVMSLAVDHLDRELRPWFDATSPQPACCVGWHDHMRRDVKEPVSWYVL